MKLKQKAQAQAVLSQQVNNIQFINILVKFLEVDSTIPDLTSFQHYYKIINSYTIEEIKKIELFCLKTFEYKINFTTVYDLLQYFNYFGYIFSDDFNSIEEYKRASEIYLIISEILEITIQSIL